ncbi:MAG: phage holin family protein [Chloroflexales bacterium]|nr:phage holin family protein [Chloroflexales bacterium]
MRPTIAYNGGGRHVPYVRCRHLEEGPTVLNLILTWVVTALSLLLITRLNVGITVQSFGTALIAALVIGLVNAFLGPIVKLLSLPFIILTLGLFAFVVNALLFWAAAGLVKGFSLRNGFWSALIGSVLLSIANAVIFWLLSLVGLA